MTNSASASLSKHTPGPWCVEASGWSNGACQGGSIGAVDMSCGTYVVDKNGVHHHAGQSKTIASYYTRSIGLSEAEGRANARLIAAAPDLLAMVKRAYEFISPNYDPSPVSNTQMAAEIQKLLSSAGAWGEP